MSEPHRMRLRNGVRTSNLVTGETEPTYGEYVLASDYDALAAELSASRTATQTEHNLYRAQSDRVAELEAALSNLLSFVMERGFHSDNPPIDAALRLLDAGEEKRIARMGVTKK